MFDELRDRILTFLSRNQYCVISTNGVLGERAVLVKYISQGLALDCKLPRWSDAGFYLEQDPRVTVIIQDTKSDRLQWLQVRGTAHLTDPQGGNLGAIPDERFIAIQITPERVDLIDGSCGWGERETLDL